MICFFNLMRKLPCILCFISFILFCSSQASANFFDEQVYPVFEPETEDTSHYLLAGGLSAAAILLVQSMDGQIRSDMGNNQLMPSSTSSIGDHYVSYGGNVMIALGQLIWDRHNGMNHSRALLFTFLATHALKNLVHQQRPDQSDDYAFPSGHASSAFATATSLSMAYGWKVGVPAFAMATLTGLSRIADDRHWGSNVAAGALLGIAIGRATFFKKKEDEELTEKAASKTNIFPSYDKRGVSLNLVHDF